MYTTSAQISFFSGITVAMKEMMSRFDVHNARVSMTGQLADVRRVMFVFRWNRLILQQRTAMADNITCSRKGDIVDEDYTC